MSTLPINLHDPKVGARAASYTAKAGPNDCWEWTGTKARSGHGQLWDGKRNVAAHRYALAASGVNVDGLFACHRCNNPGCVNPAHLYAGTPQDNINDAIAAGHTFGNPAPKGEANYNAKLTESAAAEIKRRYKPRDRINGTRALAREFRVSQQAVSKIVRGVTWRR